MRLREPRVLLAVPLFAIGITAPRPTRVAESGAPPVTPPVASTMLPAPDTLLPDTLLAEGTIQAGDGGTHAYLPVTIHGQTMTVGLDLGAPVGLFGVTVAATPIDIGIPRADVSAEDASGSVTPETPGIPGTAGAATGAATGAVAFQRLDSLRIGTAVERNIRIVPVHTISDPSGPGADEAVGFLGTDVLAHYDLAFDGPHHQVRVYAIPATARHASGHPSVWLPAGIAPADCLPFTRVAMLPPFPGSQMDGLVGVRIQVNGHPLLALFDSGAGPTILDVRAGQLLGITPTSPHVQPLTADSALEYAGGEKLQSWQVTGATITVGGRPLAQHPMLMITGTADFTAGLPQFNLGLDAFHDRVLFVSYRSRQVCISRLH